MPMQGPLAFALFWLVALAVGCALVLLLLGGGFAWLALVGATGAVVLLMAMARDRRKP